MGGYADKLSYEERWQVIHYIRSLQAKDRSLAYNEKTNSLNSVGVPGASVPKKKVHAMKIAVPTLAHGAGHGHDADHGHGGGHGHDHKKDDHH